MSKESENNGLNDLIAIEGTSPVQQALAQQPD